MSQISLSKNKEYILKSMIDHQNSSYITINWGGHLNAPVLDKPRYDIVVCMPRDAQFYGYRGK